MQERWEFKFSLPRRAAAGVVELSPEQAERLLLKRVADQKENPVAALWQLAQFYKQTRQHEKALPCLQDLLGRVPDAESKATCMLTMGQAMEQVGDYETAIRYYRAALALEPVEPFTWYFINNNLGYSLNVLGRHAEGEDYCRRAIQIDPQRPNAHKNLGISLAAQGDLREAAKCFVLATQANASDQRAFRLLQDLLKEHPELEFEFEKPVTACHRAVSHAAEKAEELKPVILRGWRKHWFLWRIHWREWLEKWRRKKSTA
jgi:tetratricopeptide (TPR) repeat protein